MRKAHLSFTAGQLQYLSIAFNNHLTLTQPNLFANVSVCKNGFLVQNPNSVLGLENAANCAKLLLKEFATRLLNKSNQAQHNQRKKANIFITEPEAHAIILCTRHNGFVHFQAYEKALMLKIIEKANQLALN